MFEIGKSVNKALKELPITIDNTKGRRASFDPVISRIKKNIPNQQMGTEATRLSPISTLFLKPLHRHECTAIS